MLSARSLPAAIQVLRQFVPGLTVALEQPGSRWLSADAGEAKRRGRRKAPPPEKQREQPKNERRQQQHEGEKAAAASAATASEQQQQKQQKEQQRAPGEQHEVAQDQEQQPGQQQGLLGGNGLPSGSIDPRLQAHIEQLRSLKGATRLSQQTLGQEQQPGIMTWLADLGSVYLQRWIEGFVKDRVERSFSASEFLEGAKDAYFIMHHLVSQQDWETLRPMVSAKLLQALRGTYDEYGKAGLTWSQELEGEVEAALRGVTFMQREQIADYDEALAPGGVDGQEPSLQTAPAGLWLVVTVSFHARQRVRITRLDDANVVADLTDLRPQRFRFARGPLPLADYPVEEVEGCPWFLLTI